MHRTFVFAYGSNLDPARMTRRVPSARVVGRTLLRGYALRFHKRGSHDGTGKANAFRTGGDGLGHGVVYDVMEAEMAALDVHESGYERRLMDFQLAPPREGVVVEAWVYLALPEAIDDALAPTRWYLDHVVAGARAHGLPRDLIEGLGALPTVD